MRSHSGRFVIAFNGEIYNHQQIRREILAADCERAFRGHSDTEVMLAAFDLWGVESATRRFNGMFAFAVYDVRERVLQLGRDRLGEKPLYYGVIDSEFLFASELHSIAAITGHALELDHDALRAFLRFGYVPAPRSIFHGISKLTPGTLLTVRLRDGQPQTVAETTYWSPAEVIATGLSKPSTLDDVTAVLQLDDLLRDAVSLRMEADVPLGAFLSGGIDSSIVVSIMQAQSSQRVKTFTIGFSDDLFNEAHHAKAIANHLGTEHTELYLSPADALQVVPRIPEIFDEPFADVSQIPTYLVAKLARQHVTVALSGDGGDELFGGYGRYFHALNIWSWIGRFPTSVRAAVAAVAKTLPITAWNAIGAAFPRRLTHDRMGDRVYKLADMFSVRDFDRLYVWLLSLWNDPLRILASPGHPEQPAFPSHVSSIPGRTARMMAADLLHYLPDDILVKVDRAAMSVGLEGRIPLLDHRIVEMAWRTPMRQKVRGDQGKWLLKEVLYRYVPRQLVDRPKMGFGIPIEHWLRADLADWMRDTLSTVALGRHGLLQSVEVQRLMDEHIGGRRSWSSQLWTVLMFQAWYDHWRSRSARAAH